MNKVVFSVDELLIPQILCLHGDHGSPMSYPVQPLDTNTHHFLTLCIAEFLPSVPIESVPEGFPPVPSDGEVEAILREMADPDSYLFSEDRELSVWESEGGSYL